MSKEGQPSDSSEELILMAESIANYRNELKSVERKNVVLEDRIRRWNGFQKASHVIGFAGVVAICVGLVYGIGFLIYQKLMAPTDSTVCHIERHRNSGQCPCTFYSVHKILDWAVDPHLGYYDSIEEAVEEARRLGCLTTNANITPGSQTGKAVDCSSTNSVGSSPTRESEEQSVW